MFREVLPYGNQPVTCLAEYLLHIRPLVVADLDRDPRPGLKMAACAIGDNAITIETIFASVQRTDGIELSHFWLQGLYLFPGYIGRI